MCDAAGEQREALESLRLQQAAFGGLGACALDRMTQRADDQPPVDIALHQVVLGTLLDRLQGQSLVTVAGHHDDGSGRRLGASRPEGFEPLTVGKRQIEQHSVHGALGKLRDSLREPLNPNDVEAELACLLQPQRRQPGVRLVVLDQENPQRPAR